ncbi:MAG: adenylate/guanylate cyclase domain-containing protein, partial [Methyloligellaceae bacterium]
SFREYRQDPDLPMPRNSPIFVAYDTGRSQRFHLEEVDLEGEYELLGEFRQNGLTDYIVLALPFSDGSFKAMSFATDRPGGFSPSDLEILHGLRLPLATTIEVRYLRHLANLLMETYVGHVAGRRVLNGEIKRGSGENIQAVIWFCDLKGFTNLSEKLEAPVLIDYLNTYLEIIETAISSQGGEILKFIGDAVLAIFQTVNGDEKQTARAALEGAIRAQNEISKVNQERLQQDLPPIACGIGIHYGDVHYGNVGGMKRLDFTVIGPAVNLASRLESLTRDLGQSILVSSTIADLDVGRLKELGTFKLKGIETEEKVFTPEAGS